jgi:phosphoglycolate phosphatase-like HAD superfamily hydrolase
LNLEHDQRVLLWDIDGTLLRSIRPDRFRQHIPIVLRSVFGTAGTIEQLTFAGVTDFQAIVEALESEGYTIDDVRARIPELGDSYLRELRNSILTDPNHSPYFQQLPGASGALDAVSKHPRYHSALLTGNFSAVARFKLELTGLSHYFTLPGAYGEDSHDRRDLPALAAERISASLDRAFAPEQFVVIGDTPNDIDCARAFGARAVAVASGFYHDRAELQSHTPDAVLDSLVDVRQLLDVLAVL